MSSTSPFWRNIKKLLVVNPAWESSMPPKGYRLPSPGSQPEYIRPVSEASAVRDNAYYRRDARRNYPRVTRYTQAEVAAFLAAPAVASISPPATESTAVATTTSPTLLVDALKATKSPIYSPSSLPPVPGTAYIWKDSPAADAVHHSIYWPMKNIA